MIDAGNKLLAPFKLVCHIQIVQQHFGADLYAVAQTDRLDAGVPLHITAENGHRIGVVEHQRIGADLAHIRCKRIHHGDGTQTAHDAADAQRVGNGLTQAVLFGNLKVNNGARLVTANLNGVDDERGAAEGFLAIFHAVVAGDLAVISLGSTDGLQNDTAFF